MTAAEARWRAERMQELLADGLERFETLAQVRQEAKERSWIATDSIAINADAASV